MDRSRSVTTFMLVTSYVLLLATFLLVVSGVTWFPLTDENGQAILGLRIFVLVGLSASIVLFSLFSRFKIQWRGFDDGILSSLLSLVGTVILATSTPDLLDNTTLHRIGSLCTGVGCGFMLKSGAHYIRSLSLRELTFTIATIGGLASILYFIVESCPQVLGIVLSCCMSSLSALLFWKIALQKNDRGDDDMQIKSIFSPHVCSKETDSSEQLVYQTAASLLVILAAGIFLQGYYCRSTSPAEILTANTMTILFSITIIGILIAILLRPISRAFPLRTLHAISLCATLSTSLLLASGGLNEATVGILSSLIIASFMGYFALLTANLFHGEALVRNNILLGVSGILLIFFCVNALNIILRIPGTSFFTASTTSIVFLVINAVLIVLASISTTRLAGFIGPGLFVKAEKYPEISAFSNWSSACSTLSKQNGLSPREEEVLLLIAQGYKDANISEALYISNSTVRTHVRNIYQKLNIHSKAELIAKLLENTPEN